jgi:integrase
MGNPCGIRDYAIILLLARLGLRSSDVANLRFSNIDWENDMICLTQVKTGNPLKLPLLSDVGEAIINYLKNARPKSDSDHVFIRIKPPYTEFNPGAVGALVHERLVKAGIRLEGRKSGSHALRHSLAKRLLEHEIPLPVISEILGHASTETTMTYLRIDINELKRCALEVPF